MTIDGVEPGRSLAWRWHPNATDPAVDYSTEAATLVKIDLPELEGGTLLTLVETGFDRLPAARRRIAFDSNASGWTGQLRRIEAHVAQRHVS